VLPYLPAVAGSALEPDPIFAAIENYKRSDAGWFARACYEDELAMKAIKVSADGPEMAALVNAISQREWRLQKSSPPRRPGSPL
jgi:hypothetical protein